MPRHLDCACFRAGAKPALLHGCQSLRVFHPRASPLSLEIPVSSAKHQQHGLGETQTFIKPPIFLLRMILTVPKDLPCLSQGPSADSLHAGLAGKQGTASLGDRVAQCQQHSHTGSHKLLRQWQAKHSCSRAGRWMVVAQGNPLPVCWDSHKSSAGTSSENFGYCPPLHIHPGKF